MQAQILRSVLVLTVFFNFVMSALAQAVSTNFTEVVPKLTLDLLRNSEDYKTFASKEKNFTFAQFGNIIFIRIVDPESCPNEHMCYGFVTDLSLKNIKLHTLYLGKVVVASDIVNTVGDTPFETIWTQSEKNRISFIMFSIGRFEDSFLIHSPSIFEK